MRSAIDSDEPHSLQPKLKGLVSLPRRGRSPHRVGTAECMVSPLNNGAPQPFFRRFARQSTKTFNARAQERSRYSRTACAAAHWHFYQLVLAAPAPGRILNPMVPLPLLAPLQPSPPALGAG
jgi:hypothetical protein